MKKQYYVYLVIDCRTGLPFYVGKGSKKRWMKHEADARRGFFTPVARRIKEIWNSGGTTATNIIFFTKSERQALTVEKMVIDTLEGFRMALVNIFSGGNGQTAGAKVRPEIVKRRSESIKNSPAFQKIMHDPTHLARISENSKKQMADPKMRRRISDGTRRAWEDPVKRERMLAGRARAVRCVETGETFSTMGQAAKATTGNPGSIHTAIRCNTKSYGHHWEYV